VYNKAKTKKTKRLTVSFPGQLGYKPVRTRKGKPCSLDLDDARGDGVRGWQWHRLDHMQTICTSLQTDNHTNTSSLICAIDVKKRSHINKKNVKNVKNVTKIKKRQKTFLHL